MGGSVGELLAWGALKSSGESSGDPEDESVVALQKKLFTDKGSSKGEVELAKELLQQGRYHHAIAVATQGLAKNTAMAGDFEALLGCSALELGYVHEAAFHLKKADTDSGSETGDVRKKCLQELNQSDRAVL